MTEKQVLSLVFSLPWFCALLYWQARHPGAAEAPVIAVAVFGSLLLGVAIALVVQRNKPRAVVDALALPLVSTFLWSILFLPGDPKVRVVIALSGAALSLMGTAWVKRRLRA
jgi:hypothetical protein